MKICKICNHEKQWHTAYGCLWHSKDTRILESVCECPRDKGEIEK